MGPGVSTVPVSPRNGQPASIIAFPPLQDLGLPPSRSPPSPDLVNDGWPSRLWVLVKHLAPQWENLGACADRGKFCSGHLASGWENLGSVPALTGCPGEVPVDAAPPTVGNTYTDMLGFWSLPSGTFFLLN